MRRSFRARAIRLIVVVCASCAAATPSGPPSVTPTIGTVTARATPTSAPTQVAGPTLASGTVTVQLAEHFFSPSLITVAVGTTVVWVDVGQQSHDVHARDGSFDSPPLSPGNTFAHTFTKAGKYPYYCVPHEGDGMFGEVDVVAP